MSDEPLKEGLVQKLMDEYDLVNLLGAEGQELVRWHLKDRFGVDESERQLDLDPDEPRHSVQRDARTRSNRAH